LAIVGITLGVSFGGGLLINEAKRGHISPRDIFVAMMLLNLLHSLIEDTLLVSSDRRKLHHDILGEDCIFYRGHWYFSVYYQPNR